MLFVFVAGLFHLAETLRGNSQETLSLEYEKLRHLTGFERCPHVSYRGQRCGAGGHSPSALCTARWLIACSVSKSKT